ncbi:MAG: hypothetical protein EON87_12645 [Brevundimonas sp.]|nr:MAG: hypothetical protein EON87_12645 [Brevundimonas sp.]
MTDQTLFPTARQSVDPLAKELTGGRFSLFDLYRASVQAGGGSALEDRVFTDCTIEGPALMLVLDGVFFDSTNFGQTNGDMRNMLFRPMAGAAIGAIPVRNCTFTRCRFRAIGITGSESLLQNLIADVKTVD